MTCNVEEWRDIPGYEGLYMVSSMGRVKSLPKYLSKTDRILRGCVDKDGYIKVRLCPNPQLRKSYFVHRLVALAFIDNELQLPEIDHLNTIKEEITESRLRAYSPFKSKSGVNDGHKRKCYCCIFKYKRSRNGDGCEPKENIRCMFKQREKAGGFVWQKI